MLLSLLPHRLSAHSAPSTILALIAGHACLKEPKIVHDFNSDEYAVHNVMGSSTSRYNKLCKGKIHKH